MPRSVAEIQADIDRVKAQIAYNQKYSQGFAQPYTKVGWNSYIINNDRGLLDQYQARENAWKQQMANIDAQKELAKINKEVADNDKKEAARLQMQRLMLQRSKLQEQGMETGDLDLQIKSIADKYDFAMAPEKEYDINKDPNYVLAKHEGLDYTDDLEEGSRKLEDAREDLMNFRTPEAVKRIAAIDKEIAKRDKYRANKKAVDAAIASYFKDGIMPQLLIDLDFEEEGVAGNRFLRSGKKSYRNPNKPKPKPGEGPKDN